MAQDGFCGSCGTDFYVEVSKATGGTGSYVRLTQLAKDVDFERNVDVTESETICNETTGNQAAKVCEDETQISYTGTFDTCPDNPICDLITPGECCWIRMHHAPFDGTSFWQNQVRVSEPSNVRYRKGAAVRPQFTFDGLGQETKPVNF